MRQKIARSYAELAARAVELRRLADHLAPGASGDRTSRVVREIMVLRARADQFEQRAQRAFEQLADHSETTS